MMRQTALSLLPVWGILVVVVGTTNAFTVVPLLQTSSRPSASTILSAAGLETFDSSFASIKQTIDATTSVPGASPFLSGQTAPLAVAGATVVAALGAVLSRVTGGSSSSSTTTASSSGLSKEQPQVEPEPIDVSIPYDAAARLAFDEYLQSKGIEFDEMLYSSFRPLYEDKAISDVIVKKIARDLAAAEQVAEEATKRLESL